MSESRLPEEILKEILNFRLYLSEEHFTRSDLQREPHIPRLGIDKRRLRCHLLLVSKRWLRIGTPVLYESVILCEADHTKAVAQLLRNHPIVGKAIRYLRIEGGMGIDLYTVLKNAPNVYLLWISLSLRCTDPITGLRKGLPCLNPKVMHIRPASLRQRNKVIKEASDVLQSAMEKHWKQLHTVVVYRAFPMVSSWVPAFEKAPALRVIAADTDDVTGWIATGHFYKVAAKASLEEIRCSGTYERKMAEKAMTRVGFPDHVKKRFAFIPSSRDEALRAAFDSLSESHPLYALFYNAGYIHP